MSTLRRILVGHSLLPDGDIALRSAAVLAERAHAALYLLHVVEPYPDLSENCGSRRFQPMPCLKKSS